MGLGSGIGTIVLRRPDESTLDCCPNERRSSPLGGAAVQGARRCECRARSARAPSAAGALETPVGGVARVAGPAAGDVTPRVPCAAKDKALDSRFRCVDAYDGKACV